MPGGMPLESICSQDTQGQDSIPGQGISCRTLPHWWTYQWMSFPGRFKKSPIYQTTRDGFVRNVVVALGNSGSGAAVPALEKGLQDASPLVRAHAAWALGRIADRRVRGILESARAKETTPDGT